MRGTPSRKRATHFCNRFIPAHAGNTAAEALVHQPGKGSSPRMRGTLVERHANRLASRFIPAHAGNTRRVGGILIPVGGSSPRMRGTQNWPAIDLFNARFIPAHAGNTFAAAETAMDFSVHPRACGEHEVHCLLAALRRGSSPRMRGTLMRTSLPSAYLRFIPAHAGNTIAVANGIGGYPVHPRACGEHSCPVSTTISKPGSSPRMRGTRRVLGHAVVLQRFIPAHAGNTCRRVRWPTTRAVHPRACGEHASAVATSGRWRSTHGSSPRMRGTPTPRIDQPSRIRFIPAHAGNTEAAAADALAEAVHPRACGEHSGIDS